jgi:hypothetical protein
MDLLHQEDELMISLRSEEEDEEDLCLANDQPQILN